MMPDSSISASASPLVDPFGRRHDYLRISVTDRCNLRCLYCMPEEGMVDAVEREELLSFEEIERVARLLVPAGIRKIRITGGEPFVRKDLEDLLRRLKGIEGLETLAVTTNGVLIGDRIGELVGVVDAWNVSLDTFRSDRFLELTGRDRLSEVLTTIDAILDAGYRNLRINCVVMRGINEDEILDFARLAQEREVGVRFIEFMPFAGNAWSKDRCVSMAEILDEVGKEFRIEPIPAGAAPISRDFRLIDRATDTPSTGTLGVIASMSTPFCSGCSRLRLTADGRIMPCLHSPLEFDLRSLLRSDRPDSAILDRFAEALAQKPEEHPPADNLAEGRVMISIGG